MVSCPPCGIEMSVGQWNTRTPNKPAEVDAQKAIDLVDLMIKLTEPTPDQTSCICFNENHSGHDEIEWTLDDWKTIRAALSGHLSTGKGGGEPAAPTQIDAGELEKAINKSGGPRLGDPGYVFTDMKTVKILREAARAHLAKSKGGV